MPPDKALPRRLVLGDEVYEAVKALFMDHEIAPGARVNIDQLARSLAVSPTPVREALARLESDGLVLKTPLVGYTASPLLDERAINELFDVRRLLEPAAAVGAAGLNREALRELRVPLAEMKRTPSGDDYQSYRDFANNDATFHDLIAQQAGNRVLRETLLRFHSHLHLFRFHFAPGITTAANEEHARIYQALRNHDGEAARVAMYDHIEASRLRLLDRITALT